MLNRTQGINPFYFAQQIRAMGEGKNIISATKVQALFITTKKPRTFCRTSKNSMDKPKWSKRLDSYYALFVICIMNHFTIKLTSAGLLLSILLSLFLCPHGHCHEAEDRLSPPSAVGLDHLKMPGHDLHKEACGCLCHHLVLAIIDSIPFTYFDYYRVFIPLGLLAEQNFVQRVERPPIL